ncbi:hypothetical protein M9H77_22153 [Catharanthus roseus]|uniref:Uncharacterized protein n=1 Tax=Catharanthus roseus TaxID=4058 RepID=A0ACC0APP0_CATRO|nr:hypothetical protein M9H77_22153 [Catharanthus roseus]
MDRSGEVGTKHDKEEKKTVGPRRKRKGEIGKPVALGGEWLHKQLRGERELREPWKKLEQQTNVTATVVQHSKLLCAEAEKKNTAAEAGGFATAKIYFEKGQIFNKLE